MKIEEFWKIIGEVNNQAHGNMEAKVEILTEHLRSMDENDILSFSRVFDSMMGKAYTWDLWAAAYIIHGGCSDDCFMDFRSSLISMGKDMFERAVSSQETLADIEPSVAESLLFEGFAYSATSVYQEKTGKLPERETQHPANPTGEKWNEDESVLQKKYPRLWKKFGESPVDSGQMSRNTQKPWWKFW